MHIIKCCNASPCDGNYVVSRGVSSNSSSSSINAAVGHNFYFNEINYFPKVAVLNSGLTRILSPIENDVNDLFFSSPKVATELFPLHYNQEKLIHYTQWKP